MAKITLPTITNGQDLTTLNNNFASIASALNTNVLYRKNIAGEDNTMQNDLDFNGFRAYNLLDVLVNGVSVATVATNAQNAANAASASAAAALASQISSASSQAAAAQSAVDAATAAGAAGSLIAVNNLSDVPNKTTARTNLVLGNVDNTSDVNKPISTSTQTALDLKANLAGVNAFTGANTGLTAAVDTNTSQYATCAYVINQLYLKAATAVSTYQPLLGRTNGSNPSAGQIGEYVEAVAALTTTSSGTINNIAQFNLTAGDWDVTGWIHFVPAGTTVMSGRFGSISTASGTSGPTKFTALNRSTIAAGQDESFDLPTVRINVSTTTTVFLISSVVFTTSTLQVEGVLSARRVS